MDKPFSVRVQLLDAAGGAAAGAKVSGVLTMKEMDHGKQQFDLVEKAQGVYEGTTKVEMSGGWNLKLTAEHGADRMQQDVTIQIAD